MRVGLRQIKKELLSLSNMESGIDRTEMEASICYF